ncbi:MAG: hypothetical protein H0U49_12990 [Parachlamydiaceae bacterium]|nr:hypothetical protein [Parachlamydiaceae bacterium]
MSWDPKMWDDYETFSACEKIASFYETLQVSTKKSEGSLGGKKYTWHVVDNEHFYKLNCVCNFGTLGFGKISKTTEGRSPPEVYRFSKSSDINPDTSLVALKRPFNFGTYEMKLPKKRPSNLDDDIFGV